MTTCTCGIAIAKAYRCTERDCPYRERVLLQY